MIAIIDYGIGNLASIRNMLRHIGADAVLTDDPKVVETSTALVLPGIGAFDSCMQGFRQSPVYEAVELQVRDLRKPILGICVGMQMMGRGSDEGKERGLNWIAADVRRLAPDPSLHLKIPHLGWSYVETNSACPLFAEKDDDRRFYFAHSFHVVCDSQDVVAASYDYGSRITCSVWANNIFGVQFHPEKSHSHGMRLFETFRQIAGEPSTRPAYDAI
jgi:glutamine amidotransferase